jgi:hypothetical protein
MAAGSSGPLIPQIVSVLLQQTVGFIDKPLAVGDAPAKLLLIGLDPLDVAIGRRRHWSLTSRPTKHMLAAYGS